MVLCILIAFIDSRRHDYTPEIQCFQFLNTKNSEFHTSKTGLTPFAVYTESLSRD